MALSTLTKKGQTTIPKEIRRILKLEPDDRILYLVEGDKVFIKPVKGNILDLRGSVPCGGKHIDFKKLRHATKNRIAVKIVERAK